jgi:hypothetical protein
MPVFRHPHTGFASGIIANSLSTIDSSKNKRKKKEKKSATYLK